jgi:O-antigen/teichoic acid export membrane protein
MVLAAIVQYLGVVVILWYWAATPPVFFAYLAGCGVIHMLILRHLLWQRVGWNQSYRRWSKAAFVQVRGFAGGMTLISLTTIFLTQIDKIVLSRLMPLANFGVYSFASNTASGTSRIIGPIFNAIYPRMTNLVAAGDRAAVMEFYQLSAQVVACLIVPVVVSVALFTGPLLRIWTRNPELATEVEPLLRWFLLGNMLSALNHVPYSLQLAHGWTSLAFWSNIISIIILLPGGILAYHEWGPVGVVAVWFVLNAGYILCVVPVMHRRLGWGGMIYWYHHGVLLPIGLTVALCCTVSWIMDGRSDALLLLAAVFTTIVSAVAIGIFSPAVRSSLLPWWSMWRRHAKKIEG